MDAHKKINELLTAFALGELSEQAEGEVKMHLAECPQCTSELKRLAALLECTDHISELSADERMVESAKQAIFAAVKSQEKEPAAGLDTGLAFIWKTIMKNPITKIAAAAVVLIVVIFVLHNGKVHIASTTYAQMRADIQKMPWVHVIVRGTHERKDVEMKQWFSDESQIIAMKKPDGELEFSDYKKGIKYVYDPNAQSISLSFINKGDYSKNAISLQNGIDSMLSMLNQQEATINHHSGQFEGEEVEIYEIQYQVRKMSNVIIGTFSRPGWIARPFLCACRALRRQKRIPHKTPVGQTPIY